MRSLSPLARVLCAALLVAPVFAASQEKPKETPRALYERAAYAEEHERDFQKAADLYGSAADAAKRAGDDKAAVEAVAARDRALARAGQMSKMQTPVDCNDPILRRIADLLNSVSSLPQNTPDYNSAARDLALFGAAAVPWVERAVTESISLCSYTIVARSDRFISVLSKMGTPEATAALERLLDSPDPVTRRDVAAQCYPSIHQSLLRRALADPVKDVRDAAIRRVANHMDPAWLPEMLDAARAGSLDALEFIGHVKPEELVSIAADPKQSYDSRDKALTGLTDAHELAADPEIPRRLLLLARADGEDIRLRRAALFKLTRLVDTVWRGAPPAFRQEIETSVAANIDTYPVPEVWFLLQSLGGARSLDALTGSLVSKLDVLDDDQFPRLLNGLARRLGDLSVKDFESVVAAFARVPAPGPLRSNPPSRALKLHDLYVKALTALALPDVADASMVAALARLDADHRTAFVDVVGTWLMRRESRNAGQERRAPLDLALVPVVRELAAGAEQQQLNAIAGYAGRRDVRLWPELLPLRLRVGGEVGSNASVTMSELVATDRAQAAVVLDQALRESIQKHGSVDAALVNGLEFLESDRALDVFRRLWPLVKDEPGRALMMRALVRDISGSAAAAVMFEHYRDIPADDPYLRSDAIQRFGNELYQPAVEVLGQALEDPTETVRKKAREAFVKFKAQREAMEEFQTWMSTDKAARDSAAQLVTLLDNANRDVVLGAVRSLAALKAKSALPALVKLLEKNDPEIKRAVQDAITKIGE